MNTIAKFKAKYGVSNRVMANLLNTTSIDVKTKMVNDSFNVEHNELVNRLDGVIAHMVQESEILAEQAPYIMVLEHEKDMQELEIKRQSVENISLKSRIKSFEAMRLSGRLKFVFGFYG